MVDGRFNMSEINYDRLIDRNKRKWRTKKSERINEAGHRIDVITSLNFGGGLRATCRYDRKQVFIIGRFRPPSEAGLWLLWQHTRGRAMLVARLLVALIPRRNTVRRCFLLCFWDSRRRKTCRFDNRTYDKTGPSGLIVVARFGRRSHTVAPCYVQV